MNKYIALAFKSDHGTNVTADRSKINTSELMQKAKTAQDILTYDGKGRVRRSS